MPWLRIVRKRRPKPEGGAMDSVLVYIWNPPGARQIDENPTNQALAMRLALRQFDVQRVDLVRTDIPTEDRRIVRSDAAPPGPV